MTNARPIRLGTRSSALARWQAEWVASRLQQLEIQVDLVMITTQGDIQSGPIGSLGSPGLFTKQIQQALISGEIDLAVHSLKDLPTEPLDGLTLAAVPPRASPDDVLVSNGVDSIDNLKPAARVGTGSTRRRAQLLHYKPDLVIEDLRGNVDTRLKKLDDGRYDAIVLAQAGLIRLGLQHRITQVIPRRVMLPAVGQGALGLEIRSDDQWVGRHVSLLDDATTHAAVVAERAMLATLRGGCLAPVGAWARIENGLLTLDGVVLSGDGTNKVVASVSGSPQRAQFIGQDAAEALLKQGAAQFIAASRQAS